MSPRFKTVSKHRKNRLKKHIALSLSLWTVYSFNAAHCSAAGVPQKSVPSGTLLLPLTPKLDTSEPTPTAIAPLKNKVTNQAKESSKSNQVTTYPKLFQEEIESDAQISPTLPKLTKSSQDTSIDTPKTEKTKVENNTESLTNKNSEEPDLAKLDELNDNTLLKGTVQIVADDTEYDQQKNTFLGTGNAVATIAGQDARLEADMILYDQATQTIDARGNVKILRQGEISTGSSFKFRVNSDEYLITNPDTEIKGTQVVARQGIGSKTGIRFENGTMTLPEPIHIARNSFYGTLTSSSESYEKDLHPDAYMPAKPNFTFKARKMVYERYKENGNLTVFGGKLQFGKFSVPLGKFKATVGEESNVTFPVTPMISNNILVGGVNLGPMFNTDLGKYGVFSWAPLVQIGGRRTSGQNEKGNIGAGVRLSYRGKKLSANLAYGSVSNLLVADLKYRFNDATQFNAGINRYIQNGLFGAQRARSIAEVVNSKGVGGIPLLQGITFRTSLGAMSDNPALLNTSPQYKQLFNINHGNIVSGIRLQEQIMGSTQPIFSYGNRKYGASMNLFGGIAARAYSSGDSLLMGQIGPSLSLNLNRVHLNGSLIKSGVTGQSPFIFDQYIQGAKSAQIGADYRVCKWLTLGGNFGYNLTNKMAYQKSFAAAIGPEDFKFLITRDTIRGINRFGFDFMYGQPVPFKKLVMKGTPDQGQFGNGI